MNSILKAIVIAFVTVIVGCFFVALIDEVFSDPYQNIAFGWGMYLCFIIAAGIVILADKMDKK